MRTIKVKKLPRKNLSYMARVEINTEDRYDRGTTKRVTREIINFGKTAFKGNFYLKSERPNWRHGHDAVSFKLFLQFEDDLIVWRLKFSNNIKEVFKLEVGSYEDSFNIV